MEPVRLGSGATPAIDPTPADWIQTRLLARSRGGGTPVGSVIPGGFAAYARVFHPAARRRGGDRDAITWAQVAEWAGRAVHSEMQWEAISVPPATSSQPPPYDEDPAKGYCPSIVRKPLVESLAQHSTSPESCWACIWEGVGGLGQAFPHAPRVRLPDRVYMLFSVTLEAIAEGMLVGLGASHAGPHLWWPSDRAWFVSTEIDFRWTYVAGTASCVDNILFDQRLEALSTHSNQRGDYLSDLVNGPVAP